MGRVMLLCLGLLSLCGMFLCQPLMAETAEETNEKGSVEVDATTGATALIDPAKAIEGVPQPNAEPERVGDGEPREASEPAPLEEPSEASDSDETLETEPSLESKLTLEQQITLLEVSNLSYERLQRWALGLGLTHLTTREDVQHQLLAYYDISQEFLRAPRVDAFNSDDQVIIRSADSLERLTIESVGEKYVSIQGNAYVQISDDSWLEATSLLYNQELEILTAIDNVYFQGGAEQDNIPMQGAYLSIRLADTTTIILDGSTMVNTPGDSDQDGTTFYLQGENIIIHKGSISLSNGSITSDPHEEPYYQLKTNNAQVHTDGTFTLKGATLYMGRVPTFYIPFYVHPGRSFSFHPSFGIDSTYGFYINTTTYLWGDHSQIISEEGSGLFPEFSSSESEYEVVDGVFLKPSDEPSRWDSYAERTNSSLAFVADYYTRSGLFTGLFYEINDIDSFITDVDFGVGMANSYHIFLDDTGNYTRLVPSLEQRSRFYTYFLGTQLPFRFFWDLTVDIDIDTVTGSLELPYYSDPYFESQFAIGQYFSERSQDMTLESILLSSLRGQRNTARSRSSLLWSLDMQWRPNFSYDLIKGLRISQFKINLLWDDYTLSPQRESYLSSALYRETVFLPKKLQIPIIQGELSGTIFSGSISSNPKSTATPTVLSKEPIEAAASSTEASWYPAEEDTEATTEEAIDKPREAGLDEVALENPAEVAIEEPTDKAIEVVIEEPIDEPIESSAQDLESAAEDNENAPHLALENNSPLTPYGYIDQLYRNPWVPLQASRKITLLKHELAYRLVSTTENIFYYNKTSLDPSLLKSYMDYGEYNYKGDLSITYSLDLVDTLFALENRTTLSGKYQTFYSRNTLLQEDGSPYLTDAAWNEMTEKGLSQSYFWIKNSLSAVLKPLFAFDAWEDTNITYNLKNNIFDYEYDATLSSSLIPSAADYTATWHGWNTDEVTEHSLSADLIYKDKFFKGEISGQTALPPKGTLPQEVVAKLYFYLGPITIMGSTGIERIGQELVGDSVYTFDEWKQESYDISIAGEFDLWKDSWAASKISFSQLFTMDAKKPLESTYSTTTVDFSFFDERLKVENLLLTNLTPFTLDSYRLRATLYDIQATYQFANTGDNSMKLVQSSYVWSKTYRPAPFWKNRFYDIILEPDFAFTIDHLDYFNNTLTFGSRIQFKIFEFMDLSFRVQSRNNATYTYFDEDKGLRVGSLLVDLVKSFNFFNSDDRRESHFKLDSVDLSFIHYMRDWTLTFSLKGDYTYKTNTVDPTLSGFQWIPEYVIAVQWTPLEAIKKRTEIYRGDDGNLVIEQE